TQENALSILDKEDEDAVSSQAEVRIFQMQEELEGILKTYPDLLYQYLEEKFSGYQKKHTQDIYLHLACLSGFLKTYSDNQEFVHNSLKKIDEFLSKTFFTSITECCIDESKKVDLIIFHEFFTM